MPDHKPSSDKEVTFIRRRHLSRIIAIQYAFQADMKNTWELLPDEIMNFKRLSLTCYTDEEDEMDAPAGEDTEMAWQYAEELINGVLQHKDELDEQLIAFARNWSIDRISLINKAIVRVGAYEVMFAPKVSPATAINEAVELAKQFGDKKSPRFINGILDSIRGKFKPQKKSTPKNEAEN